MKKSKDNQRKAEIAEDSILSNLRGKAEYRCGVCRELFPMTEDALGWGEDLTDVPEDEQVTVCDVCAALVKQVCGLE